MRMLTSVLNSFFDVGKGCGVSLQRFLFRKSSNNLLRRLYRELFEKIPCTLKNGFQGAYRLRYAPLPNQRAGGPLRGEGRPPCSAPLRGAEHSNHHAGPAKSCRKRSFRPSKVLWNPKPFFQERFWRGVGQRPTSFIPYAISQKRFMLARPI
jgi:hypothetical protein